MITFFVLTTILCIYAGLDGSIKIYITKIINFFMTRGILGYFLLSIICTLLLLIQIPSFFFDSVLSCFSNQPFFLKYGIALLGRYFACLLCYFISSYYLKNYILKKFKNVKVYAGLARAAQRDPYKTSLIIRFTSLPLVLKNCGIPLLDVKFLPYIIASFI